ncbi:MAG TPA: tRNA lysidine(34) synthetase TilS [Burkholderiaceae bacterium]|jgi:tRNA(Ile)-lysidine synthase
MAVAYSGGRDSTALLHASAVAAQEAGIEVLALHIHHGLSVHADAWLAHCESQCAAWADAGLPIRFQSRRLSGSPSAGQSVEAWARVGRFEALHEMCLAAEVDLLLLAQHRRDQAETLLLQALRGGGVAGLASMPALQWREGICWARPWLAQPREAIEAYLVRHGLSHIDDDSNTDPRFARNRLRLHVWPQLREAFPQAEASLAQSANWAQEALALQAEMAQLDLASLCDVAGLDLATLRQLSPARASNALRAWLLMQAGRPAPASLIERLTHEAMPADVGTWPCGDGTVHLYRGRLQWTKTCELRVGPSHSVNLASPGLHPQSGWGGQWQVQTTLESGVSAGLLSELVQRPRIGGERFQRAPKTTPRSLKKAWQEAGVPAWRRHGPLLFWREHLVFVPGLGLDARLIAEPGQAQFSLAWLPLS